MMFHEFTRSSRAVIPSEARDLAVLLKTIVRFFVVFAAQGTLALYPTKASTPVMSRPTIKVWMSCVPSYVETDSRFMR